MRNKIPVKHVRMLIAGVLLLAILILTASYSRMAANRESGSRFEVPSPYQTGTFCASLNEIPSGWKVLPDGIDGYRFCGRSSISTGKGIENIPKEVQPLSGSYKDKDGHDLTLAESQALGSDVTTPVGDWVGTMTRHVMISGAYQAKFKKWIAADSNHNNFCALIWKEGNLSLMLLQEKCDRGQQELVNLAEHLITVSDAMKACR